MAAAAESAAHYYYTFVTPDTIATGLHPILLLIAQLIGLFPQYPTSGLFPTVLS